MRGWAHKVGGCSAAVALGCGLSVAGTGTTPRDDPDGTATDASAPEGPKATLSADATIDGSPASPDSGPSPPCDLDNDGHQAKACGGDDCCDNDARTHPGATDFQEAPDACGSFDYDCNGKDEREYGKAATCDQAFACAGPGFNAEASCGAHAAFTTCDWLFGCHANATTRTQRCR